MTNPYTISHMNEISDKNLFSVISTFAGGGGSSIGYKLAGGRSLSQMKSIPMLYPHISAIIPRPE
jgi:DNA (cytosine-5)-methyltransferase 1